MITEDYVSFEVAKLLAEKGFNGYECEFYYYYGEDGEKTGPTWTSPYPRPTLQMAMKWLRKVYKIHITVYPYGEYSCNNYQFDIYKNREYLLSKDEGYMTNEQAIEVAIKYCLENLI